MWPFKMQSLSDRIVQLESQIHRFETITDIKLSAVTDFYAAMGLFPSNKEIRLLRLHGVEKVVETLRTPDFLKLGIDLHNRILGGDLESKPKYITVSQGGTNSGKTAELKEMADLFKKYGVPHKQFKDAKMETLWGVRSPTDYTEVVDSTNTFWNRDDVGCTCFWAMARETGMEIRTRLRFSSFGLGIVELKVGSKWKYVFPYVHGQSTSKSSYSIQYKIYELLTSNGK